MDLHVGWELAERLVKVVHLRQNAHSRDDHEHIGRGVSELVVASKGQLQSNAECFDSHDRDGSHERANAEIDERVMLAVDRSNFVDHEDRKCRDRDCVYQEAYAQVSRRCISGRGNISLPGRNA